MASLLDSYIQQYSVLTADIVAKTGKVPNLTGGKMHEIVLCRLLHLIYFCFGIFT